jgi:DNA primase
VRIPDERIEEVRAATDVVELIGGFVALKKSGKTWKGLCPFHTEKTPSFHVSPERGMYHCFGCGKGGNAIGFLMEHEGLGFLDAVRLLADRAGITLPRPGRAAAAEADEHEMTVRANRAALDWFRSNLAHPEIGLRAREYVAARGLTARSVDVFAVGFAPAGWDGLIRHLVRRGFEPPDLERAGLVTRSERSAGFYDRFRERIMFPILGPTGQPIAFGGRVLDQGEPKYLNSPETPVFRKGRGLFGLYTNRAAIRESGHVILVEGYTDLIALHQAGVENVVAPLGTAFTPEQARLLIRHAPQVTLLYDGDAAGRAAALRTLPHLLAAGIATRVALLPGGVDPDEFVRREGADAVRRIVGDAPGWVAHVASDSASAGREAQARRMADLIATVPDALAAGIHAAEAAAILGVSEELLKSEVAARARRAAARDARAETRPLGPEPATDAAGAGVLDAERQLLSLLVRAPELAALVAARLAPEHFEHEGHRRLAAVLLAPEQGPGAIDPHRLIQDFRDDGSARAIITRALTDPEEEQDSDRLANDFVVKIVRSRLKREFQRVQEELRRAQILRDEEATMRLARDVEEIKRAECDLLSGARIRS